MKRIVLILSFFVLFGCSEKQPQSLPLQELADLIRVEQTHPNNELLIIRDKEKIEAIVGFINTKQGGWTVPWYGPPVGQVYLELYKNEKFIGNFYVGPYFFGRDIGNFWSQSTNKEEIQELGSMLGINLLDMISETK